ncbi:multiple monosaccharide ABC transporter permease [Nocardioides pocheonensis]|uniref:Xylose transport system permease protein XylH n=1 Tax=Nocardioides pocheonensis TaxID=661485 RepID=A0A3N0GFE9_9ACTN|nr:multiple monosaccharide ABC transporter permease [Nocardioides pocheonensis]RNM11189.1 sugar ABC transporter permease [Nocardioides pocheonensis]
MNSLRRMLGSNIRQYGMVLALAAIVLYFQFRTDGVLLKPLNVSNLLTQNSYILILAIGMVMVIISRHIDLSVGSVAAFVGAVAAIMMTKWDLPWFVAVVLCLGLGALIGAWHGFWVAYVGIPAFIVTLASMLIFRGLTLTVLNGETVANLPPQFEGMGNGFLPEIGPDTGLHNLTMLIGAAMSAFVVWIEFRRRASATRYQFDVAPRPLFLAKVALEVVVIMYFVYVLAQYRGLPVVAVILFALVGLYTFLMSRTVIGRQIYAVGGNVDAATMSGVRTRRIDFLVLTNMGMLAALAGMVFAARLTAANPKAGVNFELDAIAAAFIGGAAVTGGVGTVVGAIIGGFVMGVLNNGMSLRGVGIDWQQTIKGLVLLAAVAFDVYNKRRAAVGGGAGAEKENAAAPPPPELEEQLAELPDSLVTTTGTGDATAGT